MRLGQRLDVLEVGEEVIEECLQKLLIAKHMKILQQQV